MTVRATHSLFDFAPCVLVVFLFLTCCWSLCLDSHQQEHRPHIVRLLSAFHERWHAHVCVASTRTHNKPLFSRTCSLNMFTQLLQLQSCHNNHSSHGRRDPCRTRLSDAVCACCVMTPRPHTHYTDILLLSAVRLSVRRHGRLTLWPKTIIWSACLCFANIIISHRVAQNEARTIAKETGGHAVSIQWVRHIRYFFEFGPNRRV